MRTLCDAILVGTGTVRDEGYGPLLFQDRRRALRRELGLAENPALVVLSRRLGLDPTAPVLANAPVRPIILTTDASPADRRASLAGVADVIVIPDAPSGLSDGLTELGKRGLGHLLCEGGPTVVGDLVAADLVDDLCLTVAPLLVGGGPGRLSYGRPIPTPRQLALRHVLHEDGVLLLRYARPD